MSEIFSNVTPKFHEKSPDLAWLAVVAGVVAYDVIADKTMSERFDEYLEHPVQKYIAIGAVAITGAHLLNVFEHLDIPDPILAMNEVAHYLHERLA